MNRRKLQKIILEELAVSGRSPRSRLRKLGLRDYLDESSDRHLMSIDDDIIISIGRRFSEGLGGGSDDIINAGGAFDDSAGGSAPAVEPAVEPAEEPAVEPAVEPAPTAAPGASVASPEASAPDAPVKDQPAAPEPPAAASAASEEGEVDPNEEMAAAAEAARNANAEREAEIENLWNRDSDGPGDVVTAPAPGEVPSPILSLSDTIDNKIDAAAEAAAAAPTLAEGTYWRRGLVDLLYSS